jgi:hypothetical protein
MRIHNIFIISEPAGKEQILFYQISFGAFIEFREKQIKTLIFVQYLQVLANVNQ